MSTAPIQREGKIVPCPECTGKGFIPTSRVVTWDMWHKASKTCETCNGYGYTKESPPLPQEAAAV